MGNKFYTAALAEENLEIKTRQFYGAEPLPSLKNKRILVMDDGENNGFLSRFLESRALEFKVFSQGGLLGNTVRSVGTGDPAYFIASVISSLVGSGIAALVNNAQGETIRP